MEAHPITPSEPTRMGGFPSQLSTHSAYVSNLWIILFTKNMISSMIHQVQHDQERLKKAQRELRQSEA
jgi:hypothetical protein